MSESRVETVAYAGSGAEALSMDIHRPSRSGPLPCVVWVHGGGWFTGDRTLAPDLADIAETTGIAFAAIDYRLSGQALFPAPFDDVCAALSFLVERAEDLGVDSSRLGLWGASAGAHLAALATLCWSHPGLSAGHDEDGAEGADDFAQEIRVRAASLGYPPVDLVRTVEDTLRRRPDADVSRMLETRLLGADPRITPRAAEASPLSYVDDSPDRAGGRATVQIAHGEADMLVDPSQSELLHRALEEAGHESELHLLPGRRHGFLNPSGRMDVELAAVMDDGLLESERSVDCRTWKHGEEMAGRFGFSEVGAFFARHLNTPAS